ncbi:ribonuclease HI family protein [Paucilactobacillus nenjiangensis]|uniref:ribonuclease HI family protein n=1 Tax=Paucilactobacillus nenjiangensis TaxID=1296540 RepID=UPI003FA1D52C
MIKIYTDGATIGNPGPTGLGALIVEEQHQIQLKQAYPTQVTNHEAEFLAAIFGFQYLIDHHKNPDSILFYPDSRLLSDAIGKNYTKHYENLLVELNQLIDSFNLVVTQWIPDKSNHGAHELALQALHQISDK